MTEPMRESPNDEYLLSRAVSCATSRKPRLLDFGCGQGRLVALGLQRQLDIYGVDTYTGNYETWLEMLPSEVSSRIRVITDGRIPFDDSSFDVVISNQVFEHVADPQPMVAEICRVLRPGGTFIAIFPHGGVWFEGHVGLYFAHWLARFPHLQHSYFVLCHNVGLGYYRDSAGVAGWTHILKDVVFYHRQSDVYMWWSKAFGARPESVADDWMIFRLAGSRRLRWMLPLAARPWMAAPLACLCHIRAGLVIKITKMR